MEAHIYKTPGVRNDLLVVIPRAEIDEVLFQIVNREKLLSLPGLLRQVRRQDPAERQAVDDCKAPVEEHLRSLAPGGSPLLESDGAPARRLLAISARSVGNNHGVVAWQSGETPRFFHVQGDPLDYPSYSCLTLQRDNTLAIRDLNFVDDRVFEGGVDVTANVLWCTYGNPVLRGRKVARIEDIIHQFADIRHALAFDRELPAGREIETEIFEGYPATFRENALRALRRGVPRQRFLHNCLGLSEENIIIMQREGTIEEVGYWLREAGAIDGLILDNGASPFCWTWWPDPRGGSCLPRPTTGHAPARLLYSCSTVRPERICRAAALVSR